MGMIKKTAIPFFLVLANVILLAHAVIPHHNHAEIICFNLSHCHTDKEDASDRSCDSHQHDSDTDSNCILKQVVLLPNNLSKEVPENICINQENQPDFAGILQESVHSIPIAVSYHPAKPFNFLACFIKPLSGSSGLRAPPVLI